MSEHDPDGLAPPENQGYTLTLLDGRGHEVSHRQPFSLQVLWTAEQTLEVCGVAIFDGQGGQVSATKFSPIRLVNGDSLSVMLYPKFEEPWDVVVT